MMSHRTFVGLCLLPLAVVTAAFFLVPMARLMVTGAEGPQGLGGYLSINVIFATLYTIGDGIAEMTPHSFPEAFFFTGKTYPS